MQKIQNVEEFKKLCKEKKVKFVIVKHYMYPERTGQERIVHQADGEGFYSTKIDDKDGDMYYMDYEFSSWKFQTDGVIKILVFGSPVMDIKLL